MVWTRDVKRQNRERGNIWDGHVLREVHIKEVDIEACLHESGQDRDRVDKILGKVSTRSHKHA